MTDGIVQVAPDSTGKKVDTSELTVSAQTVERQRVVLADDTAAAGVGKVQNAQPGASDYGLTVRPAGDGNVVLNATSITATATLWTADVSGYASFEFQLTGTFVATVAVEYSNDNTTWASTYYYANGVGASTTSAAANITGVTSGQGPIRAKYMRVRVSSFTSNTSSAFTFVLRTIPYVTDVQNVSIVASSNTQNVAPGTVVQTGALGTTTFIKSAATTNATSVKASAGNLFSMYLINNSAAVKYFKFYNKASAPTVGTDTPVAVIGIPASGNNFVMDGNTWVWPRFSTGIAFAITGAVTDADTTAVAVNDVSGWMVWA